MILFQNSDWVNILLSIQEHVYEHFLTLLIWMEEREKLERHVNCKYIFIFLKKHWPFRKI